MRWEDWGPTSWFWLCDHRCITFLCKPQFPRVWKKKSIFLATLLPGSNVINHLSLPINHQFKSFLNTSAPQRSASVTLAHQGVILPEKINVWLRAGQQLPHFNFFVFLIWSSFNCLNLDENPEAILYFIQHLNGILNTNRATCSWCY